MNIFYLLLQMSLSGSFAVIYIMVLRAILGRLPKRITYVLWAVVAFHFICVVVPVGSFAIIPGVNIAEKLGYLDINWNVMVTVYLLVAGIILLFNLVSYLRLSGMVRTTSEKSERSGKKVCGVTIPVYYCSKIHSAFAFGYFPPRIYLPIGLEPELEEMVVCHELMHIQRGDYFAKLLAFLLCVLNWYNPLIWCAFYFFVRDQETSCDELVLQKIGVDKKKQYADTILYAATGFFRSGEGDHAMAFGEANIKYRIRRLVKSTGARAGKYVAAILLTGVFFILGMFVSNIFEINRLPFMGMEEEAYAWDLQEKNNLYEIRNDGIYLKTQDGEECIYKDYFSSDCVNFIVENSIVFTNFTKKEIKQINLDTYKVQTLFRSEKGRKINNVLVCGGLLRINYEDGTVENRKLSIENTNVPVTKEILDNPGTFYNVTQWKKDGAYAYLDLDGDGIEEKIFLDFSLEDMLEKEETTFSFSVGSDVIEETVSRVSNEIFAASFDGKGLYLVLEYRREGKGNLLPCSAVFYRYVDGKLCYCGEIPADLDLMKYSDGTFVAKLFETIILGEVYEDFWEINAEGMLERKESEQVTMSPAAYELKADLLAHEEPGSRETFTISAQRVVGNQMVRNKKWFVGETQQEGCWIELTADDGKMGWVFVSDGKLENGETATEVFDLGIFRGSSK